MTGQRRAGLSFCLSLSSTPTRPLAASCATEHSELAVSARFQQGSRDERAAQRSRSPCRYGLKGKGCSEMSRASWLLRRAGLAGAPIAGWRRAL